MKYLITERHNPQLGVYYVKRGRVSNREAARKDRSIYGSNFKHVFATEQEYIAEIDRLITEGARIQ